MNLEIEGKVFKILPEQTGEGRNGPWQKQDFVIETLGEFPKKACFSAWNERTQAVKELQPGDMVKVSFSVSSREYMEKWYTDLRMWRLEKLKASPVGPQQPPAGGNQTTPQTPPPEMDDVPPPSESDDLPF